MVIVPDAVKPAHNPPGAARGTVTVAIRLSADPHELVARTQYLVVVKSGPVESVLPVDSGVEVPLP